MAARLVGADFDRADPHRRIFFGAAGFLLSDRIWQRLDCSWTDFDQF
jgi:hypothetical protein